jgi:hypothetical protein
MRQADHIKALTAPTPGKRKGNSAAVLGEGCANIASLSFLHPGQM